VEWRHGHSPFERSSLAMVKKINSFIFVWLKDRHPENIKTMNE
jgi:hypothetical protein